MTAGGIAAPHVAALEAGEVAYRRAGNALDVDAVRAGHGAELPLRGPDTISVPGGVACCQNELGFTVRDVGPLLEETGHMNAVALTHDGSLDAASDLRADGAGAVVVIGEE